MNLNKQKNTANKWIWKVSGKGKLNIVILLLLQTILGASDLGFAWLLRGIIDQAVAKNRQQLYFYSALLIGIIISQITLRAVERFLEEYTKSTMENCFKQRLFSSLLNKDYASVTAVHSGEWMNRLTSDTVTVAEGLVLILPNAIGMIVKMMGAILSISILIPRLGLLLIPGGAFVILLTYGLRKLLKKLHKQIREADGALRVFLSERLSSLLIVRSFACEQQTINEAENLMLNHKAARMRRNRFSNAFNIGFATLMNGAYISFAIYCAYGILMGTMSYGTFTAILQLVGQIQSPFANITGYLPKYYAMIASAERLMEAESYADVAVNGFMESSDIHKFYENEFDSIGLKNAKFTYMAPVKNKEDFPNSKNNMPVIMENINLNISKGQYVALTGQSGCGKSTLLKLLMYLYPLDEGNSYIRKNDGKEIISDSSYACLFAYVPQGNHLMTGTIREIISFSDKDKMQDERAIMRALRIACADKFVNKLKNGIDTFLGERGLGLSEGQMQRIAIARAIFSDNPILLLDESTSALDEDTEQQVLENLRSMTDKTVLIITHRPAALAVCDRQLIMSKDGLSEKGVNK